MAVGAVQSALAMNPAYGSGTTNAATGQTSFSNFLSKELDKVDKLGQSADSLSQAYATGGSVSTAQLMIAEQQASLAVDMVSRVASRVQSAYSTVMNMQV